MKTDSLDRVGVTEAARALGVHPNTIRKWCDEGRIRFDTLPGSGYRRIPAEEIWRILKGKGVSTVTQSDVAMIETALGAQADETDYSEFYVEDD